MKVYLYLSAAAFVVLGAAAVIFGSLNQDEGWYLYAAGLMSSGKTLYRDFFFTQGPVMPTVYSFFSWTWEMFGIVGARVFTLVLGFFSIVFASATAYRISPAASRARAALALFLLLGSNLYHVYFLAIPKTYALAALLLSAGTYLFTFIDSRRSALFLFFSGSAFALAVAARVSLAAVPFVFFVYLLFSKSRRGALAFSFVAGLALMGFLSYAPYLLDKESLRGLVAAHFYHSARGSFDPTLCIGSLSRTVRWYLPVWVALGFSLSFRTVRERIASCRLLLPVAAAFFATALLQFAAPFPYDDYQVPVMSLASVCAAVLVVMPEIPSLLLVLGMTWASSFGSPLLEDFTVSGQDRFWVIRKELPDVLQLSETAEKIEKLDPGGKEILTQDLYLAIETRRRVPDGLEMGPFSYWGNNPEARGLDYCSMMELLEKAPCRVAALSGYSFAVTAPSCEQTPLATQLEFWAAVKKNYKTAFKVPHFGQNSTTLMVLTKKGADAEK